MIKNVRRRVGVSAAVVALSLSTLTVGVQPASAAPNVTCTTWSYSNWGGAYCKGFGIVRLWMNCSSPQATDYNGAWVKFKGEVALVGRCTYGVGFVAVYVSA